MMNTALAAQPPQALNAESQRVLADALALCRDGEVSITNAELAVGANEELRLIKDAQRRVEECRVSFTRPLDELKKRWMDFFRPTQARLEKREAEYKTGIGGWVAQERERVERERRAAQEAADREQRRLEKLAEERAVRAEAKGDTAKADEIRAAVPVVVPAEPIAPVDQPAGFTVREVWHGNCSDKMALVAAVSRGLAPPELLDVNQRNLDKAAQLYKNHFQIPGCHAISSLQSSSRRA